MRKTLKLSLLAAVISSTNVHADYNPRDVAWDTLTNLYGVIFRGEEFDIYQDWPEPGDYAPPGNYMDPYYNTDGPVTMMGWYKQFDYGGMFDYGYGTFADGFISTCGGSRAYKDMPIVNSTSAYKSTYSIENQEDYLAKVITAYKGVPIRLSAYRHGGATKLLADSFYYWEFGDGIRAFSDKAHDNDVEYSFNETGEYLVKSFVLSEEFNIGIGIGGDSYGGEVRGLAPTLDIDQGDTLYIEGCDFAYIDVKENHTPKADFFVTKIEPDRSHTNFTISARSTDIDGNKLYHKWSVTGNGYHTEGEGDTFKVRLRNPSGPNKSHFSVTLTSTDKGKSDTYTSSITTLEYKQPPPKPGQPGTRPRPL
ncbi:hypothetical protein EU508_13025 [Pseudoalteromonas fuliginea]|uniref:PKD domain-containing protein n=1 Tax=Pseudoalteromonas fuliginea TaxID=1872678 RepID=A0AB73BFI8_9GAMM|nr:MULTISPECIES: hypothetical protein [Pseudoalteromonas]KAA1159480.1 hypothetical protein EU508_13025 [Pseudoalteromonas fuliginea]GAA81591.1 hypothetical protein P20495_4131 [Pseudoalteromonas sp. BSi20495]